MIVPVKVNFQYSEQCINNVLMLKTFVDSIKPLWQALSATGSSELQKICEVRLEVASGPAFIEKHVALQARQLPPYQESDQ